MNPNELYQYYLNAYSIPQSTDMGVPSVAPIADFQVRDSGIATLQPTTTGTGTMPTLFGMTPSQYAKSYVNNPANVLGTLASFTLGPIPGFLTTRGAMEAQRRGFLPQTFSDVFDSTGPASLGIGSFADSMAMAESVDGGFDDSGGPDSSDTGYDSDDSGYGGGVTGGGFGE